MSTKNVQVLYIEQTGHILAAVTRTAAPDLLLDVRDFADADLLVRKSSPATEGETLSVPMDLLKVGIVDLNESAFAMPFNFMVGGGQANDLRVLAPPTAKLDSTGTTITIDAGATVAEETKVWAQVQEKHPLAGNEPIRRIVADTIKPLASGVSDGQTVKLDLRTRPDEQPAAIPQPSSTQYSVLVLVAGRPPGFLTISKGS